MPKSPSIDAASGFPNPTQRTPHLQVHRVLTAPTRLLRVASPSCEFSPTHVLWVLEAGWVVTLHTENLKKCVGVTEALNHRRVGFPIR